jgi:pimeloyl-ACP methyl ester carboxylesterase
METLIEAPGPQGLLKGSMLGPASRHAPVVLIIPGSGPTDRDGNNRLGINASTYRLLAEGLAARNITTVRIDKRGLFASAAATPAPNAATIADYVTDIDAWVSVIRQHTGAPRIWLLGHSEGGLVALATDKKKEDICGLLLVSTPGRRMGELLREQLRSNPANALFLSQALSAIDSLENGNQVDTTNMPSALLGLFRPQVQGFLMSVFSYNPAQLLENYPKPVLILQGLRDIQVHEVDARILKQAAPEAALALLPNVNHVLKHVASDEWADNVATYADPELPLAPGVLEAICDFIEQSTAYFS